MRTYDESKIPERIRKYFKPAEIGLEETPDSYVASLVTIFREARRVLRKDGTFWLNLGDSYSAGGRGTSDYHSNMMGNKTADAQALGRLKVPGFTSKNLLMIPHRVAIALQDDGWIVRQDNVWAKVNAMPQSVTDRSTHSHEYVFQLTKSGHYWYDHIAVLEPYTKPLDRWGGDDLAANGASSYDAGTGQQSYRDRSLRPNPNGRERRSVWNIPTSASSLAHFAVMSPEVVDLCLLAGCPPIVCAVCGAPHVRQADQVTFAPACKCGGGIDSGIVLDMFSGSGTTGKEARRLGRHFLLGELNPKYVEIGRESLAQTPVALPGFNTVEVPKR